MASSRWIKLALGSLIGGLLIVVCVGGIAVYWLTGRGASSETVGGTEPLLDRIAFVGNDGNLWLASTDGEEVRNLTKDGRGYHFPTWSPDGHRLAFVGPDEEGTTALYVSSVLRGDPEVLFTAPNSAPFYVYWSPDNRSVTFLTQEPSGMAMRLADADKPGTGRVMAQGAPFYWAWSPEGDQLLMHVGGARIFSEGAHLSLLENKEGADRIELKLAPGRFQAPIWSADGQYIFYIAADEDGQEAIYKTDVDTSRQTLVAELFGAALMVLSPDDAHIAYLHKPTQGVAFGIAHVVDQDGRDDRRVMQDPVAALYWSPDGKKLALLALTDGDSGPTARAAGLAAPHSQDALFQWWIYDVGTETLEPLITFQPTADFMQTVPFFDQYHLSLTFWSPDSRYLVTTRLHPESTESTVWVLDTTGQEDPLQIGEGTLAVWSWR